MVSLRLSGHYREGRAKRCFTGGALGLARVSFIGELVDISEAPTLVRSILDRDPDRGAPSLVVDNRQSVHAENVAEHNAFPGRAPEISPSSMNQNMRPTPPSLEASNAIC